MKNATSILLLVASIALFFLLIKPTYGDIVDLRDTQASYKEALEKIDISAETLKKHQATLAAFDPQDVERLNKALPDNADNVQLVIDINTIASKFGLITKKPEIKDPRVEQEEGDAENEEEAAIEEGESEEGPIIAEAPYNSIDLSFTVTSTYSNFVGFLESLEQSLRLVDVVGIAFIPPPEGGQVYDFRVTVRTYWVNI